MKHLFTVISLVLMVWPATAEESTKVSTEVVQKAVTKSTSPPSMLNQLKTAEYKNQLSRTIRDTTGFFSLSVGIETQPMYYFTHYSTSLSFRYGGYFSAQHGFEAGVKMSTQEYIMIMLKYNYDFIRDNKWVPGLDIALLVGTSYSGNKLSQLGKDSLDAGLEIGPYIKTFISRSHALCLRTGVAYDTSGRHQGGLYLLDFRLYLDLGIQWHF